MNQNEYHATERQDLMEALSMCIDALDSDTLRHVRMSAQANAVRALGGAAMATSAVAERAIPTWQERAASDPTRWSKSSPVRFMQAEIDDLRAALKAQPAPTAAPTLEDFPVLLKDHNVRQLVNDLRDIAIQFHAAGQLRARISGAVGQFLDKHGLPKAPTEAQGRCAQCYGILSQSCYCTEAQGDAELAASGFPVTIADAKFAIKSMQNFVNTDPQLCLLLDDNIHTLRTFVHSRAELASAERISSKQAQGEAVYQVFDTTCNAWEDILKAQYDRCNPSYRRILYASAQPSGNTGELVQGENSARLDAIYVACMCKACNPLMLGRQMFICPKCGDKNCPHATNHVNRCSGNAAPQPQEQS